MRQFQNGADKWYLFCSAQHQSQHQSVFFEVAQSPFEDEHSVSLASSPATTASAQYLIEYSADYGSFHIASQQAAEALTTGTVYTTAAGSISLTTTEPLPLPLHIDASWTYALPTDWMMTRLRVSVFDLNQPVTLFSEVQTIDTLSGQPASGTTTITSDVVLPANAEWGIQYAMELWTFSGPQGFLATGDGPRDGPRDSPEWHVTNR